MILGVRLFRGRDGDPIIVGISDSESAPSRAVWTSGGRRPVRKLHVFGDDRRDGADVLSADDAAGAAERKAMEQLIANVKKNDHVETIGGICGTVVNAAAGSKFVTIRV